MSSFPPRRPLSCSCCHCCCCWSVNDKQIRLLSRSKKLSHWLSLNYITHAGIKAKLRDFVLWIHHHHHHHYHQQQQWHHPCPPVKESSRRSCWTSRGIALLNLPCTENSHFELLLGPSFAEWESPFRLLLSWLLLLLLWFSSAHLHKNYYINKFICSWLN